MTELIHQMRDSTHGHGGSVGSIPSTFVGGKSGITGGGGDLQTLQKVLRTTGTAGSTGSIHDIIHSTPASNLKLSEAMRTAQHDGSPTVVSSPSLPPPPPLNKLSASKSYTNGLNNSTGTVQQSSSSASSPNSSSLSLIDISPINSQFFEVMYVGKIKVSHKRVPFTFIDDALPKFKAYDAQKIKMQTEVARRLSAASVESETISQKSDTASNHSDEENRGSGSDSNNTKLDDTNVRKSSVDIEFKEKILNTKLSEENKENNGPTVQRRLLLRGQSQVALPAGKFDVPKQRNRSASIGSIPMVEQNRTMVFLVGKTDLRLISPDRKQVLLYKHLKDVASCAQGLKNADHFGIICREPNNGNVNNVNDSGSSGSSSGGYIGYVFKCQSDTVADDIIMAISRAIVANTEQKHKQFNQQIFSCEHCPMLWYHKLCSDVDGLSDKKTQSMIFRRIEQLSDDEQNIVMAKYYGAEEMADHTLAEQNQFLMMLLRAHCESRQQRHVHDTAENRSEFLNQYLGGSTIFMKAKRSLSNSFDHLLKRKNSKDDIGTSNLISSKDGQPGKESIIGSSTGKSVNFKIDVEKQHNNTMRPRSSSIGSAIMTQRTPADQLTSPMMDIFIKVGNSPKDPSSQNDHGSWRQEMLNRVVTPSKNTTANVNFMSPHRHRRGSWKKNNDHCEKRTAAELRQLWKTAIRQTIMLARMEKENARLQACHNDHELRKIKLDYDEIRQSDKYVADQGWDQYIDRIDVAVNQPFDRNVLRQAIRAGVPRTKRGEIWLYLADQFTLFRNLNRKSMLSAIIDEEKFPNFNTPYSVLLKSLTEHQHAIFIDLGRTFPNHTYYKAALGVGQLSLFNILKAYSILDPELGYCQGLGFICGILLLHCEEEQAFNLLKHLMFHCQMRNKYLPDMKEFQLQLYQLSRLVRDHIPELYDWLDQNDVSPTLYAAPWILTVFSSQFPLGFVTRIFDVLFLDSPDVIFKFAIALLSLHKHELLLRDNFEDVMDYLKNTLPKITPLDLDKIMDHVFSMDVSKQLSEYQVEYNVLQEEISTANHHLETLKREKEKNRHLETQLQFAQSTIAQLENNRTHQQNQLQNVQTQLQTLESTVQTLGHYLAQLVEKNHSVEMPGDVRRLVQNITNIDATLQQKEQRSNNKIPKVMFAERKIGKSMSVNAQLGYPLKVLEELNESLEQSPTTMLVPKKSPFFNQQQQQQIRPNRFDVTIPAIITTTTTPPLSTVADIKLPKHVEKALEQLTKSPIEADSGIATPLSPSIHQQSLSLPLTPSPSVQTIIGAEEQTTFLDPGTDPLSSCGGDVSFIKFNGTTQLKSIRSTHHYHHQQSRITATGASTMTTTTTVAAANVVSNSTSNNGDDTSSNGQS